MTVSTKDPVPFCIAVVSGKGGVGKTMLASNVAWVCGQLDTTLLIDLDFQNQGATGLFKPHFDFSSANAFLNVSTSTGIDLADVTMVDDNLYFLPAVSWRDQPTHDVIFEEVFGGSFHTKLQQFLTEKLAQTNINRKNPDDA